MPTSDAKAHRWIAQLLAVPAPERRGWLQLRLPDDAELLERLLAAVGENDSSPAFDVVFGVPLEPVEAPTPTSIGRYQILNELGQGGMGRVFLALDPNVDRHVAIKFLRGDFDNEEFRKRFWREARSIGRLRHRNIVTIFDIDEDEGSPFIVMEYVPGRTLQDIILKREPLPLEQRLLFMEGVCAGLACAHSAGVVHRDIKPANIIVGDDGIVKILDFGVAKPLERNGQPQTQLTNEQTLVGTVGYIAPEHLAGSPSDFRSDMFAAAVVAYELITYAKPFGETSALISRRVLTGDVTPISSLSVSVPPAVEQVVLRGLSVVPHERFRDMATMERRLGAARADLSSPVQVFQSATQDPAPTRRAFVMGASVLLAALGLLAAVRFGTDRDGEVSRTPDAQRQERISAGAAAPPRPIEKPTMVGKPSPGPTEKRTPTRSEATAKQAAPLPNAADLPVTTRERVAVSGDSDSASPSMPTDGSGGHTVTSTSTASPEDNAVGAPPSTPPTDPRTLAPEDLSKIYEVLRAFESAFENLSSAQLLTLHPSLANDTLSVYDRAFADNKSYTVQLAGLRISADSPGRARVLCSITRLIVPKVGAQKEHNGSAKITLRQEGQKWLIESFVPPNWW